jgi:hypothetical protein
MDLKIKIRRVREFNVFEIEYAFNWDLGNYLQ